MATVGSSLKRWMRQVIGPPLREMSRAGKIVQTLWDASQLQIQSRESYRKIGELTLNLVREGKLQNIEIERLLTKLERTERILKRQELVLRGAQERVDLREILREDRQPAPDALEP